MFEASVNGIFTIPLEETDLYLPGIRYFRDSNVRNFESDHPYKRACKTVPQPHRGEPGEH